jgi:cytochrome c peroxidase
MKMLLSEEYWLLGHDYAAGPLNSSGATGGPVGIASLPFYIGINATGEVKTTTDPGRALVTGLWADVGKTKGPILRGLAGRTPYFHNGSALTLNDVITFYNKRFNIGFTQQNQQDLVAFLSLL